MADQVFDSKGETELMTALWAPDIAEKPSSFVLFNFPWGQENTPLAQHDGPRQWQLEDLDEIGQAIIENRNRMANGQTPKMFRKATVSGRGTGKSAETAWLTHWMMSTKPGSTAIVTANTEQQLKSRTWAELGKWNTMALNGHWFDVTATSLRPSKWYEETLKKDLKIDTGYYYAQAQLWSEDNPDAFAGVHNPHGVMVIFDEASGIPHPIWTVTEGFFTEPELHRYWFAFSNGRRNTGAFFECFHKARNTWRRRNLDSRDVEGTDRTVLQSIINRYGEDSDEARVEVKGMFPRQGDKQFISSEVVSEAREREMNADPGAALILGVDVARSGSDMAVLRFRRGRDARSIPALKFKGLDNMQLAYRVAEQIDKHDPDAVCIDAGAGTGVIDRLRELGYRVNEVWFGSTKTERKEFFNKRSEMWGNMRDWLIGGCIDDDPDLTDDLLGPEYEFSGRDGDRIILEPKERMRKRGLDSPDDGDALALTFAVKVARKGLKSSRRGRRRQATGVDYDVLGG